MNPPPSTLVEVRPAAAAGRRVELMVPRADDRGLRCHYIQCRARLFRSFSRRQRFCRRCARPFSSVEP